MASSVIIKADVDSLLNMASNFESQGSQVSNITSEMMNLVTGLSSQWEGDASQVYIGKFRSLEDDIQKLVAKINEYVSDLQSIANVYRTHEEQNVADAQSLESDVIS